MGLKARLVEITLVLGIFAAGFAILALLLKVANVSPAGSGWFRDFVGGGSVALVCFLLVVRVVRAMDFHVVDGWVKVSRDGSELIAFEGSRVNVWSPLTVYARSGSQVSVRLGAIALAESGSKVTVESGGTCFAETGADVTCRMGGKVVARAGARVHARDGGEVFPWGGVPKVRELPSWAVRADSN